jgi:diguanylate cyclase (GGDEF)-like protein
MFHTDHLCQVAENIRDVVEASMPNIGEGTLKITASIGVAGSTATTKSMLHIQQQTDQAMYKAKSQGRNRVSVLGEVS